MLSVAWRKPAEIKSCFVLPNHLTNINIRTNSVKRFLNVAIILGYECVIDIYYCMWCFAFVINWWTTCIFFYSILKHEQVTTASGTANWIRFSPVVFLLILLRVSTHQTLRFYFLAHGLNTGNNCSWLALMSLRLSVFVSASLYVGILL